jgi:hypothetical protein
MREDYNNPDCLAFWDEFQSSVILNVDLKSWGSDYALKYFGKGYQTKTFSGRN